MPPQTVTKLPADLLTPAVASLVSSFLSTATTPDRATLLLWQDMLERDPVSRLCAQTINLYVLSALGDYKHPKPRVQKMIRNAIANCKGSWRNRLSMVNSHRFWGFSVTELAMPIGEKNQATLGDVRTLPPVNYTFKGQDGELTTITYSGGVRDIDIDYGNVMHLVSGSELNFDMVSGSSILAAALPYWELHKVLMPVLAIAAQRQATPILVQTTETGGDVVLLDDLGQPRKDIDGNYIIINKGFDVVSKLAQLKNSGVVAIDKDDNLYQIEPKIASDFLGSIVELAKQMRMMAFLLPPTPFGYSPHGSGDSGLSDVQLKHFKAITASWAQDLGEAIIEAIVRPLILYNFGDIGDWGEFPVSIENEQALEIAKTIIDAVARGSFSKTDIKALNVARMALGIEEWASEDELMLSWEAMGDPSTAVG